MPRSSWCMAAPGARKVHELCRYKHCSCDCHRASDPSKIRGFAVESGAQSGPESARTDRGLADWIGVDR